MYQPALMLAFSTLDNYEPGVNITIPPSPHTDLVNLDYFDGENFVPLNAKDVRLLMYNEQANGRWYTLEFEEAFIQGLGADLKLALGGMIVNVTPPPKGGPYWLAHIRPGLFLNGIRLAQLHPHPEPDRELYQFGFGAVWSDWIDSPRLAHRQHAHRLRQHIAETGRPY